MRFIEFVPRGVVLVPCRAIRFVCGYCDAQPGELCSTLPSRPGQPTRHLNDYHSQRLEVAWEKALGRRNPQTTPAS